VSLSGRDCSCKGRNKNCNKCSGSGLAEPATSGRKQLRKQRQLDRGDVAHFKTKADAKSKVRDELLICALCGSSVRPEDLCAHAECVHGPTPRSNLRA
jgi:hypothetical protein